MATRFDDLDLGNGYHVRAITGEAYREALARLEPRIFGDYFTFDVTRSLSNARRAQVAQWKQAQAGFYRLCLGIYFAGELVGWQVSQQVLDAGIQMLDTGLLPEHQGKGTYSRLLPHLIAEFRELGFDHILSFHRATNNAVIIPKLRAGFLIQGFQMDEYGLTLRLLYPFNDTFRESLQVRSGERRPAGTVAELMGLKSDAAGAPAHQPKA
ncbi:MAG TPA: GNAT family N-acetyltransferase [Opitutaceae bacterium]